MYAYACFDLECLYRELAVAGRPRMEVGRALSMRAEELVEKISGDLRNEVLAAENPDAAVVAVADGFAKSMEALCRGLLEPILSAWVCHLPL